MERIQLQHIVFGTMLVVVLVLVEILIRSL